MSYVSEEVNINFTPEDEIVKSIKNNFPNISPVEISKASFGGELRNMLEEEKRIELFPNKKEIQSILVRTIADVIEDQNFTLLKSNVLKRKSKDYIDEIGFYHVRGSFDPTYGKRFLWLEKIVKQWTKAHEIQAGKNYQFLMFYPFTNKFYHPLQFNSYFKLANRLYPRIKFLKEVLIPEFEALTDISNLNKRINYGNQDTDRFNGYKRSWSGDKRIILINPIVSILSGDENYEEIIKKEVLNFLEESEKEKYWNAFENLKKYGA